MKKRYNFTLVELLVAMGIFCLLLMVSMQIFGGAQKLWVGSEQKNDVFASARTAMEFVASRVQACVYMDNMPFGIYEAESDKYYKKIFFPTTIAMNRKFTKDDDTETELDKYDIRFVGFQLNDKHELEMRIFSDKMNSSSSKNTNFIKYLPPYSQRRGSMSAQAVYNAVKAGIDGVSEDTDKIVVAEHVISFKLIPFNVSGTGKNEKIKRDFSPGTGGHKSPPYLLEIEITMLDSASYAKWKDAGTDLKKEIETEHAYTFRRAVLLGYRRYRDERGK